MTWRAKDFMVLEEGPQPHARQAVCALGPTRGTKIWHVRNSLTFQWENFPRQSLDFSKNCAGISCFITYLKSIFFAYAYSSGARNSSWVLGKWTVGWAAAHTCSTGSICLTMPCTDLLEAIYGLRNRHPLLSLRFWPALWTYYTVKRFSLPLSTKVWPVLVNHYRKASCDQKIMDQVTNELELNLVSAKSAKLQLSLIVPSQ